MSRLSSLVQIARFSLWTALIALLAFNTSSARAQVETVLHSFAGSPNGCVPMTTLTKGTDGNFYGTTFFGGAYGGGAAFKITPAGAETVLHSFAGGHDSGNVNSEMRLTQGSDGNFYGTTGEGGTYDAGRIFKMTPAGALSTIYSFTGGTDGNWPTGALALGANGNLYGTTEYGGEYGDGNIFEVTPAGTFTNLYSLEDFNWGGTDGESPVGGLTTGADGNFYGTTTGSGADGYGTVFKVTPTGAVTTLYSFTGGADGADCETALTLGPGGDLYGSTRSGGANGAGTFFKITTAGALTTICTLSKTAGFAPLPSALELGDDGNFYGRFEFGGTNNKGAVIKISPTGTLTVLYSFASLGVILGGGSGTALALGTDGNFYGVAGTPVQGSVFKVTSAGILTTIFTFTGGIGGEAPYAGLTQGANGNLYGAAAIGGANADGSIFEISPTGTVTTLYSFTGGADGGGPFSNLTLAKDGNFYGSTYFGGTYGAGTLFKITPAGNLTTILAVGASYGGAYSLTQATDGNFYITTTHGGVYDDGAIVKITPAGATTLLYSFSRPDGENPSSGLTLGTDGSLYGTTSYGGNNGYGTIFKFTTAGVFSLLYTFTGGSDGSTPISGLTQGTDGNFYGATSYGGAHGFGTIYKVTPGGALTTIYSFSTVMYSQDLPINPDLTLGANGNLYGTTSYGGDNGIGSIFEITPSGVFTKLHSFAGGDGAIPSSPITFGADGSLYGTTPDGGANGGGTVYRLGAPSRFDFNGDGMDDLIWANSQTGQVLAWDMTGTVISPTNSGSIFVTINPLWKVMGVADINADGHPDLLWWNSNTGQMIFWEMTGAQGTTQLYTSPVLYTVPNTQWQPVSMADFNGDGHPDILWQNMTTGQLIVWYMNGMTQKSTTPVFATLPANCRVAGTGDFNQDGHPDIVVENVKTGAVSIWYMGGSGGTTIEQQGAPFVTLANTAWQIASTGDMNGDGHPDLTWHNSSTGQTIVWLMGGANGTTQLQAGAPLAVSPKTVWSIVGVR